MRQCTAVGVAKYNPPSSRFQGCVETFEGVVRIRLVAIEEMLRVKQDFFDRPASMFEGIPDHADVLVLLDPEGNIHMVIPGLADHAYGRR